MWHKHALLRRLSAIRGRSISQLVAGMVLLAGFLILGTGGVFAQETNPTVDWRGVTPWAEDGMVLPVPSLQEAEVFYDDLTVSSGDSYPGDVVVYNGDARVEGGGRIGGSLLVYSGEVSIQGAVGGDVVAYGGDVKIQGGGSVGGNVQALGGDVVLQDGARVAGDVSVLGGDIERSAGAQVGGNVLSGPRIPMPELPALPGLTPQDSSSQIVPFPGSRGVDGPPTSQGAFARWLWRFVLDLFGAALFTLLAVLGSGAVLKARPQIVDHAQAYLEADPRTSFGVGLLANMVVMIPLWMWLGSLTANWFIALCLTPLLLPLGLVALGIEVAGLAVAGRWLGRRMAQEAGFDWPDWASTAVGVTLIAGASGFLWAISACLGWLGLLFGGAAGVGALVLHWRDRRHGGASHAVAVRPSVPAETPAGPPQPPQPSQSSQSPQPAEMSAWDSLEEPVAAQPAPLDLAPRPQEDDTAFDFTTLSGIGPVFSMRLRAANVRSLGDLAGMSAESLADVLNVSVDRVVRDDVLGQARRLLGLE